MQIGRPGYRVESVLKQFSYQFSYQVLKIGRQTEHLTVYSKKQTSELLKEKKKQWTQLTTFVALQV